MIALDLSGIDRDVERAYGALLRFRRELRAAPDEPQGDPLASFRHVSGKNAYDALREYPAGVADEPLRMALLRWMYALTQSRVAGDLEVRWAEESSALRGRVRLEVPRATSYREAWRSAVTCREASARTLWLEAAADLAPPLSSIGRERIARRVEVAGRLSLARPQDDVGAISVADLTEAARGWLRRTSDLRSALRRESRRNAAAESVGSPVATWIECALATDAAEGWPARLTLRWFDETFPRLARQIRRPPDLPSPAGAASYALALQAFGRALRESHGSALPFAVRNDPFWVDSHRFGFLFGALPMQGAFWRRLGLGGRAKNRQVRALARVAFLASTWTVVRWWLARAPAELDSWREVMQDVFGGPVDDRFAGAWPAWREDDAPRFEALLTSQALSDALVSQFDEDWFSNPRAAQWIASRAAGPAVPPVEATPDARHEVDSLARFFEGALG